MGFISRKGQSIMREIIENPTYMRYEDMEKEFDGRWILITRCEYDELDKFIGGIPVAIADKPFQGQSDGFYDEFKASKYSPMTDINFAHPAGIFSFFSGELKLTEVKA